MIPRTSSIASSEAQSVFIYRWFKHGFFCEYNYMLVGILHCLMTNRRFALSSRSSPYLQPSGWNEFFEPFCPQFESALLDILDRGFARGPAYRNLRGRLRKFLLLSIVRPLFFPWMKTMIENWDAIGELAKQDQVDVWVDGVRERRPLLAALQAIHQDVWRYNESTQASIEARIAALALPRRYAALHVRRGDKDIDCPHTKEEIYVERLEALSGLKDVYVFTDEYGCVETLRRLRPEWNTWCLCPHNMRGYFHSEFIRKSSTERREDTLRMLVEIEILRAAEIFVGTFSSGIGEYQGIARADHTYGVDFDHWVIDE
jgi:hypothetical protein